VKPAARRADSAERSTTRSDADRDKIAPSAEAILDAAEALFGQRGYASTSVSAICAASALPVGSIYHHFANKLAILSAVLDRAARRFFTELDNAVGTRLEPERRMRKYFEKAPHLMVRNANYLRIIAATLQHDGDEQLLSFARQSTEATATTLAAVIEPVAAAAGVPDPATLSLDLARMTFSYSLGAAIVAGYDAHRLNKGTAPLYEIVREAIDKAAAQAKGSRKTA
jgi:AcrR family transcriptional regulator